MNTAAAPSILLGSLFLIAAFFTNTLQSVFGKSLESQLSVEMFTWVTFLTSFVITLIVAAFRRFRDLPTAVPQFHILRGFAGFAGFLLFIAAAQLTSLINANVLLNTTPIFIPIMALLFLRQQISAKIWLAIILGFAGVVIIVRPDSSILTNPGNLLGLAAGFITAIEFLAVKHLDESDSPLTQMIYFLLIGTVFSTLLVIGKFQPITQGQFMITILTGICLVLFQFLLIKAYVYAKPHEIGAFQYSSVVFAALFGWVIFKENLDMGTIVGTVLICIGGIMSILKRS